MPDEHYFVSKEVRAYFAEHKKKLLADYDRWEKTYNEWRKKNSEQAKVLDDGIERKVPADLLSKIPNFPADAKIATRKAGSEVLQPIAQAMPLLMSGSADLHGSTLNYIKDGDDFTPGKVLLGHAAPHNDGSGMYDTGNTCRMYISTKLSTL